MPLVTKRRRRRGPKERGERARSPEQRRQWQVAARHEPTFIRLYTQHLGDIRAMFRASIREALSVLNPTPDSVLAALPFYRVEGLNSVWDDFGRRLENAYRGVVISSARDTANSFGWKFLVEKQEEVLFNPEVTSFMRNRSLMKVQEMSEDTRATIRSILTDGLESGLSEAGRAGIAQEVEATIGLTEFQRGRVAKRAEAMRQGGFTQAQIEAEKDKFSSQLRKQRAETIARTETLQAQTEGMKALWKQGQEAGLIPADAMQAWQATNDDLVSDVCEELDKHDPVPLGESFTSSIVGSVDGPPAHPNCRSTLVLVLP